MGANGLTGTIGDFTEVTNLSVSALNTDLLPKTDVSLYKWFSMTVQGTFSGTLQAQGSNDGVAWSGVQMDELGSVVFFSSFTGSPSGNTFTGPCKYRYLRIRCTSYTSGTATAIIELYTIASNYHSGFFNAATNDGNGNPIINSNPLPVHTASNNAAVPAGVATTVVKASAGDIISVTVTSSGATAATNIYDNPSTGAGTLLLVIPASATQGQIFLLQGYAKTGITAVGVAGSPALTVFYN